MGAPRGAWLRGALWGLVDLLPVVHTALAGVVRQIGRSAALLALRRGDVGWGTLCGGGGGGGGACEAESSEGCRGDDGGEDSSNVHSISLSRIASVGALVSLIFTHVGGTSCCAIRVTALPGAGWVRTKREADDWLADMQTELRQGDWRDPDAANVPFGKYAVGLGE